MWARTISVAKEGCDEAENEDRTTSAADRFALADGVSQSARSEVWAQLLVDAFVVDRVDPLAPDVLAALRHRWEHLVNVPGLEWLAKNKLTEHGGAATFVGLAVDARSKRLSVQAVGDSCFFHFRGDALLGVGPLADWHAFSQRTVVVPTTSDDEMFRTAIWKFESTYQVGDIVTLTSDALAQHLLRYPDRRNELLAISTQPSYESDFAAWVERERGAGRLHDDDTTICAVFV